MPGMETRPSRIVTSGDLLEKDELFFATLKV